MPADDELVELLRRALDHDAPPAPSPDRIAVLRARVEAARDQRTPSWPPATIAPNWPPPRPTAPAPGNSTPRHDRGSRWLAVAALVVAAAAGVVVGRSLDRGDDSVAGDVEYEGTMLGPDDEPAGAELTVRATGIGRLVDLHTDVLPILPAGELYEVWFVAADDSSATPHRISAGTFHPDPEGRSDVQFTAAANPELYRFVEITAEPGDGNPQATGPAVLRAQIAPQP